MTGAIRRRHAAGTALPLVLAYMLYFTPMLQLRDVKKSFVQPDGEPLPVLNVARFDVAVGEQVVVRGPSGGGKTTLLHVVAGISTADSGTVLVDEVDITRLPESGRDLFRARNIGYVFQTFNLLAAFTAMENVMLGMTFTGRKREPDWAEHLLERVGLSDRLHYRPAALSVGQQQRVAVARALANRPRLLLADEPTANIDPGHQQQVIDLIRQTCEEQSVALVLVTHSDEVAAQFERAEQLEAFNQISVVAP